MPAYRALPHLPAIPAVRGAEQDHSRVQQLLREEIREARDEGVDLEEMWLGDELPDDTGGWWDNALMVRTADDTWRFSFAMWCHKIETTSFPGVEGKPLKCPDDPTPVWADSIYDLRLFAPNQVYYWQNQNEAQHQYYGQPPS